MKGFLEGLGYLDFGLPRDFISMPPKGYTVGPTYKNIRVRNLTAHEFQEIQCNRRNTRHKGV